MLLFFWNCEQRWMLNILFNSSMCSLWVVCMYFAVLSVYGGVRAMDVLPCRVTIGLLSRFWFSAAHTASNQHPASHSRWILGPKAFQLLFPSTHAAYNNIYINVFSLKLPKYLCTNTYCLTMSAASLVINNSNIYIWSTYCCTYDIVICWMVQLFYLHTGTVVTLTIYI